MKHIFSISLFITLSLGLFAQPTAIVKQQADQLAAAILKSDYKAIIDHTYPRLVQMMGGKEKMRSSAVASMSQMQAQGVTFENATVGTPGKFYKAGKEIHCLVPETITMKVPSGHFVAHGNLLAISSDGGKTWSFIDLNKRTISAIPQIFPNFNPELKIPEPEQPVMQQ